MRRHNHMGALSILRVLSIGYPSGTGGFSSQRVSCEFDMFCKKIFLSRQKYHNVFPWSFVSLPIPKMPAKPQTRDYYSDVTWGLWRLKWPVDYLFPNLFGIKNSKHQISELLDIWEGNIPVTGGFSWQRANNAYNVSSPWPYDDVIVCENIQFLSCYVPNAAHFLMPFMKPTKRQKFSS